MPLKPFEQKNLFDPFRWKQFHNRSDLTSLSAVMNATFRGVGNASILSRYSHGSKWTFAPNEIKPDYKNLQKL